MARVVKQSPQACTYHLHPGVPTPSSAPTCQQRADGELNKGPASALARGDTVVLGRVIDGRKERARGHFSVVKGGLRRAPLRDGEEGWEEPGLGSMLEGSGGRGRVGSGRAMQGLMPYGQVFGLNL